jgi:hypothetical protein
VVYVPGSSVERGKRAITLVGRFSPFLIAVLFAIFPLVALFQQNQTDIELGVLWRPLAVCVVAAVALSAVFMLVFRSGAKAGLLASLVVVAFLYYGVLSPHVGLRDRWFFLLWVAAFALAFAALARTRRDLRNLALIVGVGAAVLAAGPLVRIAVYQARHPLVSTSDPRLWPDRLARPVLASGNARPDVYVLIPDDYARVDVLRRYFGYSDAEFLRELKQRGFVISDHARAPYSDSEMNIAAALNMGYLDGLAHILGKGSQDVRPVRELIADSRASRLLKSMGYRYVHIDSDEVTFPAGNPRVASTSIPDSLTNLWLQKSVLKLIGGTIGFDQTARDKRFRESVRLTFARLAAVSQTLGPKFVVFHTLVPHDPYVFGSRGQAVRFPYHSDQALGSRVGMAYYLRQLRFLNRKLLETVDAIRAHSRTPPVIVLQADEGFQADSETFGEAAMQQIRVKGLIALALPGVDGPRVPHPPNTVNTLRFVFNRTFGTHYKLLRSASYPELDLPYQFEEMRVR